MDLFNLSIILGMTFGIAHGIYVHRLGNYLKNYHRDKWEEIVPKKLFWIPRNFLESRSYFSEMSFVFSSDNLNDDNILSFKRKIKLFLLLSVISWLSMFFFLLM
jgi:hypothetical protein